MKLTQQEWDRLDAMISGHVKQFATVLAEALSQSRYSDAGASTPTGSDTGQAERFCHSYGVLTKETGMPRSLLQAIRRASHGQPDSPFRGRGAYPSWIRRWLAARPDFAPDARN